MKASVLGPSRLVTLFCLLAFITCVAHSKAQQTQVLPPALSGSYGETSIPLAGVMQQIYHEGQFWGLAGGGPEISITEIRCRVDESVQTSTAISLLSLRLYLSNSQKGFSADPAENYGSDRRLVFDGQNATFLVSKPASPHANVDESRRSGPPRR
jgi:hypothetical protein